MTPFLPHDSISVSMEVPLSLRGAGAGQTSYRVFGGVLGLSTVLTGELSAQKPPPVTYNEHDFIYLLAFSLFRGYM